VRIVPSKRAKGDGANPSVVAWPGIQLAPPFLNFLSAILELMQHIIYLPGVGDHKNSKIQIRALKKWKRRGIDTHFHHIYWNDEDSFKDKLNAVLSLIDELYDKDSSVSIVGVSAGASMAMNAYIERKNKISAVIFICGKIKNSQTLGDDYKKRNPRLFESVSASEKAILKLTNADKAKMLTVQPIYDGTVAIDDGRINGVKHTTIFALLHPIAIILSITIYKRLSINFIKSKSVQ